MKVDWLMKINQLLPTFLISWDVRWEKNNSFLILWQNMVTFVILRHPTTILVTDLTSSDNFDEWSSHFQTLWKLTVTHPLSWCAWRRSDTLTVIDYRCKTWWLGEQRHSCWMAGTRKKKSKNGGPQKNHLHFWN